MIRKYFENAVYHWASSVLMGDSKLQGTRMKNYKVSLFAVQSVPSKVPRSFHVQDSAGDEIQSMETEFRGAKIFGSKILKALV